MTPADLKLEDYTLLTEDDLPCDDDEVMETQRHKMQMDLLIDTLHPWLQAHPNGGYAGGDMFVYYSPNQVKNEDFKGPDFFAALGVSNRERKSWVCWQEGKPPDIVIELLSDSTAANDKTHKKQVYQDRLKVREYYWFDPWNPSDWAGFQLQSGGYVEIPIDAQGKMTSQVFNLALVRWEGQYFGVDAIWLRWAYSNGTLLPSREEIAEQAQTEARQAQTEARQAQTEARQAQTEARQAQTEARQAQTEARQAQAQVRQIVLNLRQVGMGSEQISQVTGLTIAQIEAIR